MNKQCHDKKNSMESRKRKRRTGAAVKGILKRDSLKTCGN